MTKKMWKPPELIVILRSKPEEGVLGFCKRNNEPAPGGGPSSDNFGCNVGGGTVPCLEENVS